MVGQSYPTDGRTSARRSRCARCFARGPPPALGAQLPVRAVPLAAALGTQPRGETLTAPPSHVRPQGLPVGGMRRAPSCGATVAPAAVRAVTLAAATAAQPRGAVSVACSRGSGGQGAPAGVADVRIGRGRSDGGRRQPASQAHGPGHPAVEPTAADHARLDGRRRGQLRVSDFGNPEPAPAAVVPLRHGAAPPRGCRCRASVRPAGSPAGTSRTGRRRRSVRRSRRTARPPCGEPVSRRRGPVAPPRNPRTASGRAGAGSDSRAAYTCRPRPACDSRSAR